MSGATPPTSPSRKSAASWAADEPAASAFTLKKREQLMAFVQSRASPVDDAFVQSLFELPLFQGVQVVHRFVEGLGPRIVNRHAYGSSIVRMTQRWWTAANDDETSRGPNTELLLQMCIDGALNPDVFTPAVCHVLQMLSKDQVVSVASGFSQYAFALHVANDSYYAKQQLFLSMLHAALIQSPSATLLNINVFETPETAANEAALLGRKRADASAANQLRGMLTEFIARTCARAKTFKEYDLDGPARDFLSRRDLLMAMQAVEHFAATVGDHVAKKSAFLMGIVRSLEQHWAMSVAARDFPGGSAALLSLRPRLLLRIANLCLDGHCKPTDFTPEVCVELQHLEVDLAVKIVLAFNSNKRISAGGRGGVLSRSRFFLGLIRNQAASHLTQQRDGDGSDSEPELNVLAKPFVPVAFQPLTAAPSPASPLRPNGKAPTPSLPSPLALAPQQSSPPQSSPLSPSQSAMMMAPPPPPLPPQSPRKAYSPCPSPVPSTLGNTSAAVPLQPSSSEQELKRLLDSSRDAIAHLTSALVRTRTNEIRLQRALEESQREAQMLQNQLAQFTARHL